MSLNFSLVVFFFFNLLAFLYLLRETFGPGISSVSDHGWSATPFNEPLMLATEFFFISRTLIYSSDSNQLFIYG